MKKIVLLAVYFTYATAISQNDKLKKVDSIIASTIQLKGPGIMVGIVKEGKIVYEKYRGLANIEHQVKISEKTKSNIASTAKQFTALMILQLSLEEKLSLEDDVRKYLTSIYPKVKEQIKIRHLINHTSGIRDYVELMSLQNRVWWKQIGLDNDDVLELIKKQENLGFIPGSRYSYSNTNYNLLAKVIEKVTEKKFTTYSKKFFEELGMQNTEFIRRYMQVIPNKASPYSDWGYGELFHSISITKTAGEGFLYSTLKDQLRYEQAVQNAKYNNNILLIKSQEPISNSEIKTYGFGLKLENRLNRKAVHHDGVTHAYNSQTLRFPEEQLTVFIMSNNGNIRSDLMANGIAEIFLSKLNGKERYDSRFYTDINTEETKILDLYTYPNGYRKVEIIEKEGGKIWKEPNFSLEMIPLKKNIYTFATDSKMRIVFYQNEMVEFYPSGKRVIYKRDNKSRASFEDFEALVGNYKNNELDVDVEIKMSNQNELKFKFSNDKKLSDVKVYNKMELLVDNNKYIQLKRDVFNRVVGFNLIYGRALNIKFDKKTNLKYQPKIDTENGSIQVTTIASKDGKTSDILLTKNSKNGNEIWSKRLGGKSWDKASSIINTNDGYLIIGSTSSYGNGNYDIYAIKTDKEGKKIWQNSYGKFYNDYGYSAEKTNTGYLIKGTIQNCTSNTDVFNRDCKTNVWYVNIDKKGKEISNSVLEEIKM